MKFLKYLSILLFFVFTYGADLKEVNNKIERDLKKTLKELSKTRDDIAKDKIPLAKQIRNLEEKIKLKEKKASKIREFEDDNLMSFDKLKNQAKQLEEQGSYIKNLFLNYIRKFKKSLQVNEKALYDEDFKSISLLNSKDEVDEFELMKKQIALVDKSIDRLISSFGVYSLKGEAANLKGEVIKGDFVGIGPIRYFKNKDEIYLVFSDDSGVAKIMKTEGLDESFNTISLNQKGFLSFDPSFSNSIAVTRNDDSVFTHLKKGGFWIYPIVFFGLLAFVVSIMKSVQIYSYKVGNLELTNEIRKLVQNSKIQEALRLSSREGAIYKMLKDIIENRDKDKDFLEELSYENTLKTKTKLEKFLYLIAITASVSPLLGLLGTVTGIIKTFKMIMFFGSADAKLLSAGISEALVTTEIGLIVAIPSLVFYALLKKRVQSILILMEKSSVSFINKIK